MASMSCLFLFWPSRHPALNCSFLSSLEELLPLGLRRMILLRKASPKLKQETPGFALDISGMFSSRPASPSLQGSMSANSLQELTSPSLEVWKCLVQKAWGLHCKCVGLGLFPWKQTLGGIVCTCVHMHVHRERDLTKNHFVGTLSCQMLSSTGGRPTPAVWVPEQGWKRTAWEWQAGAQGMETLGCGVRTATALGSWGSVSSSINWA